MRQKLIAQIAVCALLLLGMLLSPSILDFMSSVIRLFTEGNTFGKHFVFLGFFIFIGAFKLAIGQSEPSFVAKFNKGQLQKALFMLIALGFAFNIIANLLIFQEYGAPLNGYVAHVTKCGKVSCWEATYLQHSHSLKPAINFLDQSFNLNLGPNIDTGKPMSEITPHSGIISIIAIAILASIFILSLALAIKENKYPNLFLLQLSSIASIISVLDGGLFTVAGINAAILLALYAGYGKKASREWKFYLAIAAYVLFIGEIIPRLLGTNLSFLSFFAPSGVMVSFFIIYNSSRRGFPRMLKLAAFLLLIFSAWHLLSLFNYVYYGESVGPSGKAVIYGFPDSPKSDAALAAFGTPKLARFYRYGWYAAAVPSKNVAVSSLVNALRPSVAPKGYFLGEADTQSPREESISIIIRSPAIPVEISTLSFKPLGSAICENRCVIRGTASLFATHLALEISSYLHSKGYDAIVITPVMWDYSK